MHNRFKIAVADLPFSQQNSGNNILRLCLRGHLPCNNDQTINILRNALFEHFQEYCNCRDLLSASSLICTPADPGKHILSGTLDDDTANRNMPYIQFWMSSPNPILQADGQVFYIDKFCSVQSNSGAIAGTFFAAFFWGILLMIIVGALIIFIWRRKQEKQHTQVKQSPNKPVPVKYNKKNQPKVDDYEFLEIASAPSEKSAPKVDQYEFLEIARDEDGKMNVGNKEVNLYEFPQRKPSKAAKNKPCNENNSLSTNAKKKMKGANSELVNKQRNEPVKRQVLSASTMQTPTDTQNNTHTEKESYYVLDSPKQKKSDKKASTLPCTLTQ